MVEISKIQAMVAELTARLDALGERLDDRVDPDDPGVAEELARLEAELAALEAEERRLDEEFDAAFGATGDGMADDDEGTAGARAAETSISRDVGDLVDRLVSRATSRLSDIGALGGVDVHLDVADDAEPIEESVPHAGQPVRIRNQAGPVRVRPGPDAAVSVAARRRGRRDDWPEDTDLDVSVTDDAIEIQTRWPGRPWRRAVALDVTVPTGTAVEASSGGGAVRIDGTGGQASARTGGGSVRTTGTTGQLRLQTGSGSIRAEDHDGPVEAQTGGGSIRVEGRLTDRVHAATGGGSVRLTGIDGAVVDARSGGGSVAAEGRPDGGSRLRSGGGSVRLCVADDADVEILGSGTTARSTVPGVQASRRRLEGKIGAGSRGVVELRSGGGSVSVEPL